MNPLIKLTYPDGTSVWIGSATISKVTVHETGSRVTCNVGDSTVNHIVTQTPEEVCEKVNGALSQVIYWGRHG